MLCCAMCVLQVGKPNMPDSNYDNKDYLFGVRCRYSEQLPIIVEFDCSDGRS